jgi:hypothetical protein
VSLRLSSPLFVAPHLSLLVCCARVPLQVLSSDVEVVDILAATAAEERAAVSLEVAGHLLTVFEALYVHIRAVVGFLSLFLLNLCSL